MKSFISEGALITGIEKARRNKLSVLIKIIRFPGFAAFTVFLVTLQNVIILQIHFGERIIYSDQ